MGVADVVRMLGLNAALADWRWHRGGKAKARSRRRQRAAERAGLRAGSRAGADPCHCSAHSHESGHRCMGGPAYCPDAHWCAELHSWHD